MASKKNTTKPVINEKAVKQTISAYKAEIIKLRKESDGLYRSADTLNDKIYKLEDGVNELNQVLRLKTVLALVSA